MTDEQYECATNLKQEIDGMSKLIRAIETGDTFYFGDLPESLNDKIVSWLKPLCNFTKQKFEQL